MQQHTVDVACKISKEGEWVPYEGPQGGDGWQNTETGRVEYQERPPGELNTDLLSDEQVATIREEINDQSEQNESIAEVDEIVAEVKEGDIPGFEARRKLNGVARDATGIEEVRIRVYDEPELAGKITKDLIEFSQRVDVSGLDKFSAQDGAITDELKGIRGIASGVYLSENFSEEIIINYNNYNQEQIDEWNESEYSKALTDPESLIRHEFAHYFHEMNTKPKNDDGNINWENTSEVERIDEEVWEQIMSELGRYAGTNIAEFIAEAFTYQMNGNELPDELRELYERFDGPEVPQ